MEDACSNQLSRLQSHCGGDKSSCCCLKLSCIFHLPTQVKAMRCNSLRWLGVTGLLIAILCSSWAQGQGPQGDAKAAKASKTGAPTIGLDELKELALQTSLGER